MFWLYPIVRMLYQVYSYSCHNILSSQYHFSAVGSQLRKSELFEASPVDSTENALQISSDPVLINFGQIFVPTPEAIVHADKFKQTLPGGSGLEFTGNVDLKKVLKVCDLATNGVTEFQGVLGDNLLPLAVKWISGCDKEPEISALFTFGKDDNLHLYCTAELNDVCDVYQSKDSSSPEVSTPPASAIVSNRGKVNELLHKNDEIGSCCDGRPYFL